MHLSVEEIVTTFFLLLTHLNVDAVPHNNVTFVPMDATTINVKQTATENDRTPFDRISEANNHNRKENAESRKRFQKTMDAIFNDYRKYLSPTEGVLSASCWLNVTTAPVALIELAELDERLYTILDFQLKWSDERLAWNITETEWYYMPHDPNMVWTPKIEIGNPHDTKVAQSSKSQRNVLNVIYDGSVSWRFILPIDTICEVDSTYYPFDRQICEIDLITHVNMFGCAIHFEHKINQQKRWKLGNGNWRFVDHRVYQYTQEDRRYYTATLVYMFERKPTSHLIIYIVPLFVLVSLAPLVFLLPKDGGDRMGLALTVLLAISVYMTLVADRLPDASEPVPIVTSVFFVWYISNAMIVIVVLVNARIYRMNPKRPVPRIIQQFVFFTARLFCIVDQEEEEAILANRNGDLVEGDEQNRVLTSEKQRRYKITWKHVSSALDKWLVTGLYATKAIFAVSILTWLSNGDKDKMPYKELEEGQEPYVYEDNLPPA